MKKLTKQEFENLWFDTIPEEEVRHIRNFMEVAECECKEPYCKGWVMRVKPQILNGSIPFEKLWT